MKLDKEAWIILYVNEHIDHLNYDGEANKYQPFLTVKLDGKWPQYFPTYESAMEYALDNTIVYFVIVPVAGEPAMKLHSEQQRLYSIPHVGGSDSDKFRTITMQTKTKEELKKGKYI
jgi:hypothetical protein